MGNSEARKLIAGELESYRAKPYEELAAMVGAEPVTFEKHGENGGWYQLEVMVFWDHKRGGNVRVVGNIDDGGFQAFCPLSHDFIMSRSGNFVGE